MDLYIFKEKNKKASMKGPLIIIAPLSDVA